MPGLQAPAEIILDQWGIPSIYAGSTCDAIFLQGHNAARDRLWQTGLWRKRGHGLLAKNFGPAYAAQDRAARLFLYRGDMERKWAAYGPEARSYIEQAWCMDLPVASGTGPVLEGTPLLTPDFHLAVQAEPGLPPYPAPAAPCHELAGV